MRKGINVFWILAALISVVILVLSCFECVEGVSYSSLPAFPTLEPYVETKTYRLFPLISIPTVISALASFLDIKVLNVFACVILSFQSIVVTFAHKVYKTIDDLLSYIGKLSYDYNLTTIGIVLSFLCWLISLVTFILTVERFGEKRQSKTEFMPNATTLED